MPAPESDSPEKAGTAGETAPTVEPANGTALNGWAVSSGPATRAADEAGTGFTILVAEDEPALRSCVERVLKMGGFDVLTASDGAAALELAARHPGPIHLLLTDVMMPRLDGRELRRELTNRRPEIRTLFMSGFLDAGLPADAEFLSKPFAPAALLRKVDELLGGDGFRVPWPPG